MITALTAQPGTNFRGEAVTTAGITLTAGSANTKGSYSEIIAATAFDASMVWLTMFGPTASRKYLVDIAVGAASSEQIVLSNWFLVAGSVARLSQELRLGLAIPAGTRLSGRVQSATASATVGLFAELVTAPQWPASGRIETVGANTAATAGVSLTSGTSGSKSSYVELVSSTAFDASRLYFDMGVTSAVAGTTRVDIAIGAGGSEQIIAADLVTVTQTTVMSPTFFDLPVKIPAGSRIAFRAASSAGTANVFEATGYLQAA